MTDNQALLAIEGVRFFGEMTASVSHEIKNVLAIINENAGLLQDMLGIHEKGIPLSPERLSQLAQSIARQVNRGDGIVKGMNRFAHSADDAQEQVDVGELVQFVTRLASRLVSMKGQPPNIDKPEEAVTVRTNRFFLENLVWRCLCQAMDACPADRSVSIQVDQATHLAQIRFYGLDRTRLESMNGFPSSKDAAMARLLKAKLVIDNETCEICIILP